MAKPRLSAKPDDAPTKDATDEALDPSVIDRLLADRQPLTDAQRRAFRKQVTDAHCDESGAKTRAKAVLGEAIRWAVVIDKARRKHPGALRRYGADRFAHMLECVRELAHAVEDQEAERKGVGAVRSGLARAEATARERREDLVLALTTLAGDDADAKDALATATGTAKTPETLAASLEALADLAAAWLKKSDDESTALVASVGLEKADVTTARKAAKALRASVGDVKLEGSTSGRDTPTTNRREGRVLEEMRLAMKVFAAARRRNKLIPALTPGPATDNVLVPYAKKAKVEGNAPVDPPKPAPTPEG